MSVLGFVKKVLGFDGVVDTGLKIVEKLSGTDWLPQQQAEFILKHAEVTKYQSPTRRLIAVAICAEWIMLVNVWLFAVIAASIFGIESAASLSTEVKDFMSTNINIGMNAILGFYFLIGMKK